MLENREEASPAADGAGLETGDSLPLLRGADSALTWRKNNIKRVIILFNVRLVRRTNGSNSVLTGLADVWLLLLSLEPAVGISFVCPSGI